MTNGRRKLNMIDATNVSGDRSITLPVSMLQDRRLSAETRGALAFALTQEEAARRLPELLMAHGFGKARAFRVLRELKAAGYCRVHSNRRLPDGTQSRWWYEIAACPIHSDAAAAACRDQ
jgi:hypothetical protein